MNANPLILALRAALLVLLGILGRSTFAETDQTAAPIGEFFDPDNLENIGKVQSGAEAPRDAKRAKDLAGQGKYKDMALEQFQKYQNSKVGLMTLIRKIQKKTHAVISKASERVDKWRTTVPKIRSYSRRTLRYADGSYDFARTFEMSDLWDIDRDFSREMEWRLRQGRRLGLSIWDFLVSRVNREDFLKGIEGILFPDYVAVLNRSAVGGFHYVDEPSESEKVPLLVLHESLDVLNAVQRMAESQLSPSDAAPGLSRQQFDNHRIREALFDSRSGYTDQAALLQDIRNKQYEIAVQRSIVRDHMARLDVFWGRLAAQKLEAKERATAAIAGEVGTLSGVELDPAAWILERFGLEDRAP